MKRVFIGTSLLLLVFAVAGLRSGRAQAGRAQHHGKDSARAAAKEKVLYSFTGRRKGGNPQGPLTFDPAGDLYGAAISGGGNNPNCPSDECGAIFELTPKSGSRWGNTLVYAFKGNRDGAGPNSVILDSAGNLYGTTYYGGKGECIGGCGYAFELTPTGGPEWSKSVLYEFNGREGEYPVTGLVFDPAGNLYGTVQGGDSGFGAVFELVRNGHGGWTQTILKKFSGVDGDYPDSSLVLDAAGNVYGTTGWGGKGACQCGVVFELVRSEQGRWKEKVLHDFGGADGSAPYGVVFDDAGNLYGSTLGGGKYNSGVVFELSPEPHGKWKEKILYAFSGGADGGGSVNGVILDAAGNLYGTTNDGGDLSCAPPSGCGVVFELIPSNKGPWKEKVLHVFTGGNDGNEPNAVIQDNAENLFGTTFLGGPDDSGIAFEITPQ